MSKNTHAMEVEFVEFTARHIWKYLRLLLGRHLSKRCKTCLLSERHTPLNVRGICKLCEEYKPAPLQPHADSNAQARLDHLLKSHQGKGPRAYDALILVSGGKDSAYMLARIMREYPGLRLLSVLVDNGFMSPFALENATAVLKKFDVPHLTVKPKPGFVKKVFHFALTNLHLQKGYSMVDLLDGFITFDHAKNLAAQMEIPLVLCGLSKVQLEDVFGPISVEFDHAQECAPLVTHAGLTLKEIFTPEEMQHWFDGSKYTPDKVPHFVLPFTVWDQSEVEIMAEVERLGLITKKRTSPLLTNNALIPVIGMAEVARFGYCSWEVEFARMVREGKSERGYWLALFEMLEYSTKTGKFINKTVDETLATLGLTKRDIGIGNS